MSFKVIAFIVLAGGILGVLGLTRISLRSSPLAASEQCPLETFMQLSDEEQADCIAAMGGKAGFIATVEAAQQATARAKYPNGPVNVPTIPVISTPRPAGYIPPIYLEIKPLHTSGPERTAPSRFQYGQSVWHVGAVMTAEGDPTPFFVAARPDQCALQSLVFGHRDDTFPTARVGYSWDCPEDIGDLTITGATGPTGIITATDALSRTITFDLANETWTLEGTPWLPVATPVPRVLNTTVPYPPPVDLDASTSYPAP